MASNVHHNRSVLALTTTFYPRSVSSLTEVQDVMCKWITFMGLLVRHFTASMFCIANLPSIFLYSCIKSTCIRLFQVLGIVLSVLLEVSVKNENAIPFHLFRNILFFLNSL